jgi:hypothetical protein
MQSDHVYYTLKIFENFMFLEDENVPLVLGGLTHKALKLNTQAKIRTRNKKFSKQHTSGMTSINIYMYNVL